MSGRGDAVDDEVTEPGPDVATVKTNEKRWLGLTIPVWFRIAVAIGSAPIVISAIRNGLAHWYPTGDAAHTAVRINDVFMGHLPLTGMPAAPSINDATHYSFPGAFHLYLLALPVKLLGISWGLLVGMALINVAWFVTAAWLIRRRVGYRAALLACVFLTSLVWSVGSQVVVDPTPMQIGVIAFATLLVAAWSVADGDALALLPLAVAGNFLLLDHLKFTLVASLLCAFALGLWAWHLRRARRTDVDGWPRERARQRHWFAASVGFTIAVWLPPIAQQVFLPGGNLGKLLGAMLGTSSAKGSTAAAHRSLLDAIGVVSSTLTTSPLWLRNSFLDHGYSVDGPTRSFLAVLLGTLVLLGLIVLAGRGAWRRRDRTLLLAFGTGAVAWVGWLASAMLNPSSKPYEIGYFHSLWPLSMFIWMVLALALLRMPWAERLRIRRNASATVLVGASMAVTVVLAVLSVPRANFGAGTVAGTVPVARQIRRAIVADPPRNGPVLLDFDDFSLRTYYPVVLLALQQAGVKFRVRGTWNVALFGQSRRYTTQPRNVRQHLMLSDDGEDPPGSRLVVAARPRLRLTPSRFESIGRTMHSWGRSRTSLRIAPEARISPESRAAGDAFLATLLGVARAAHESVFDQPVLVSLVAHYSDRPGGHLIDVPGLSNRQVDDWLHDQDVHLNRVVYLYLSDLD